MLASREADAANPVKEARGILKGARSLASIAGRKAGSERERYGYSNTEVV